MALSPDRIRNVQTNLRRCGWPVKVDGKLGDQTKRAIRDFKRGILHVKRKDGTWRKVRRFNHYSGRPGRRFRRVLDRAAATGGHCSKHFRFAEWKCKEASRGYHFCGGWIRLNRSLVKGLEKYRDIAGPTSIISGYRCPGYNKAVGGASQSQHLDGEAADLVPKKLLQHVSSLHSFNGIGYQGGSGLVRHVDVGHTWGSVWRPVVWEY